MWRLPHAARVSARWSSANRNRMLGRGGVVRLSANSRTPGTRTQSRDRIGAENEIGRRSVVIGKASANGSFSLREASARRAQGGVPIQAPADYPAGQETGSN